MNPAAFQKAIQEEIQKELNKKVQCYGITSGKFQDCFECRAIVGHYCFNYLQGLVDDNGVKVQKRIIRAHEGI
jgi:hypothetical protein